MYICSPHLYTVATLPCEVQKSHYSTVLFIRTSDYLRYRRRKQTVIPSPITPENVTALTCKMHNYYLFHFSRVSSTINPRYGRVVKASCCDMAEFQQSVVDNAVAKKTGSIVSVQKMVTLNICCNIACLTYHLPHITTGRFQSHQRLEECNIPSIR